MYKVAKQPNGKYCVTVNSDVYDGSPDFLAKYNLSREEAIDYCISTKKTSLMDEQHFNQLIVSFAQILSNIFPINDMKRPGLLQALHEMELSQQIIDVMEERFDIYLKFNDVSNKTINRLVELTGASIDYEEIDGKGLNERYIEDRFDRVQKILKTNLVKENKMFN